MDLDSSVSCPSSRSSWSRALVFASTTEEYSEPRSAWIIFSGCLWWKYVTSKDEDDPESLLSFRGGHGIILPHLQPLSDWTCVERTIRCEETEYGTAVIVPGKLTRGKQRNKIVEIALVFNDNPMRENFVISLRVRIAPWQLLHHRMMKWHSMNSHSRAVLRYIHDSDSDVGINEYCYGILAYSCLPLEGNFVVGRSWLSYEEMTTEEVCELEEIASIEKSIYVVGRSCEWFARCMNGKFSEIPALFRPNVVSLLESDRGINGTALRDFFEAQKEAMSVLENMEAMFMRTRKMTLSGMWQEQVSYTLDRLHVIFEALLHSNDFVERFNASRSTNGSTRQYNCVVRELNTLIEYDDETDESDMNEQRLLLECVGTIRRFLFEGEPYAIDVDILRELADTFHRENDMDATGDLYQKCLDITRRLLGEGHVSEKLLDILMELAEFHVACDTRWKAIDYYRESLSVSRKLYGEKSDRMETASILFEIGDLFRKEEDYVKAKFHLLECYEMRRRLNVEIDDSTTVTVLVVLADVLFEERSLDDAELRYRESLDLWERVHGVGVDDNEVAYSLQKLAEVMEKKGELDEAVHIFNECLLMRKRLVNEDDESIADVLFSLGRVRAGIGELDEAELLCGECVAIMKRIRQDYWSRPNYALALHELAKVHRKKVDLLEASRVHREFFKLFHGSMDNTRMYSRIEEDVWCSSFSTKRLSLDVVFTKSEDETEEALRDALSIHQNRNGECHHPNVVLAMYQLGGFLLRKTTRSNAHLGEEMIRKSFSSIRQRTFDYQDHWLVSEDRWFEVCCLLNMGKHYLSYGYENDSERVYRECLSMLRDAQGTKQDCLDIAECLSGISKLSKTKRSEKKNLLWESFETVRRVSGESADDFQLVVNALEELVRFGLDYRDTEDVKVVVQECLDLAQHVHGEGVDHGDVSKCFHFMGRVMFGLQDLTSSEHWYRMSWEMKERLQGGPAADNRVIYELGDLALSSARFDDAERLFRESLEGQPNEVDRAVTFQVLARSLFDAGKVKEARRIFIDCLDAFENARPGYPLYSIWFYADFADEKCLDEYPFSLDFLELRKHLLPDSDVHSGDVIAFLWLARAATFAENFHNAERWSTECLRMMNRVHGDQDSTLSSFIYFELGRIAADRGSNSEAEKFYRTSLGMNRRLYGSNMNHVEHAMTLNALAELLLERRELGEAEKLYRDFLEIHKKCDEIVFHEFLSFYVGDLPNIAASMHILFNLAEAYVNEGSCSVAENLLRECLDLARQLDIDSTKSVDLAFLLQKLACLVFKQGQLLEAKELFYESLDLFGQFDYNQLFLADEPLGFVMDTNLAVLNPSDESEEHAYRMSIQFHGLLSYDSGMGFILDRLGSIAKSKGCSGEAGDFWSRSVTIKRHIFGKDETYSTLLSLLGLAGVRLYEHSYDEAADLYRECREKYRILGKNIQVRFIGSILIGLTRCLFERGELDQACGVLEESEKILEESCCSGYTLAIVRYWQSRVAYERHDTKAATEYIEQYRECYVGYYVGNSDEEIETAAFSKIVRMQAWVALDKGDFAEAGQHTWKCLTMCRKLFRENAKCEELACTLGLIVRLEVAKGELEEAAEYLEEAFDIRRGLHGAKSDHAGIAELLSLRAQLQFERGAKKDAVSTMEESLAMYRRVFMKTPNHRKIAGVERQLQEWQGEMEKVG